MENKLYYIKNDMFKEYKLIASNIEEAIKRVKTLEPDIIIIEIKLLEENVIILV